MPKGFENDAKIDARTLKKSMSNLVTKKIIKVIKIHVFLNGKIIQTHCKKQMVLKVSQIAYANGKGIKKHKK